MGEIEELRRADAQLMQALRQTQLELTESFAELTKTLTEHSKLLGALVSGQVAMMEQLGAIAAHLGIEPPESPQG
ncbi:hypothetical protein ACWEKM_32990 [Streptomyces sp. NPDC004752]